MMVIGLAWNTMGGSTLYIEAAEAGRSKGSLKVTGNMKEVMRESTEIAHTVAKIKLADWVRTFCVCVFLCVCVWPTLRPVMRDIYLEE